TVDRLTTFSEALERARDEAKRQDGERSEGEAGTLSLQGLELALPQGRSLLSGANVTLRQGEPVLVTGPSGAGKSTLFRAIAGIWPYWHGKIRLPAGARLLFLPQKPYLPIGSLMQAVAYPLEPAQVTDEAARGALEAVGLEHLAGDLAR